MPRRRLDDDEKRDRLIAREIATSERHATAEHRARELRLHREQQARWAKANPDCVREYQDKWKEKNRDYFRQHDRDRYAADTEKIKARRRAYHAANRDRINAERRAKAAAKRAEREALQKPAKKIRAVVMPPNRV